MGKLFGSLYIYIILSLLILTGAVEKLWPHKEGEQAILLQEEFSQSIALLLNTPNGLAQVKAHYPTEVFAAVDVLFLQEQHQQLANQQGVISFNQQQQAYWSFLLGDEIVRVGPIDVVSATFDSSWPYFIMLLLISVPIGLWSFLLLRDFNQLQQACKTMAAPEQANFVTGYSSVLLPITDLLQALQQRIKQLLSSQKELTSAVSHEFRTPLARLKFAIAMIEEDDLHEAQYAYLDGMKRDITELEALVSEMLKFAQMDRETPKLNYSSVDLVELTQQLVKKLQQGDTPKFKFMGESTLICQCDSHFITRALQNLIGNAIKYADQVIEIRFTLVGSLLQVTISDDGIGIAEQDWPQVFKPFIRLDKSRDKEKGGFGLGLAIVEKIVHWHQGEIIVQQGPLVGASFMITIPLKPSLN